MEKAVQLSNYIKKQQAKPFVWGEHDCALFAANWLLERTGRNIARQLRGCYCSEQSSIDHIQQLGYVDLSDAVHGLLGKPIKHVKLVQRGDIALLDSPQGIACGIVCADGVVALSHRCLITVPLSHVVAAWRVK